MDSVFDGNARVYEINLEGLHMLGIYLRTFHNSKMRTGDCGFVLIFLLSGYERRIKLKKPVDDQSKYITIYHACVSNDYPSKRRIKCQVCIVYDDSSWAYLPINN